jgi:hypothetical protein
MLLRSKITETFFVYSMSKEVFNVQRKRKFVPIEANGKNDIWQIDLMFMTINGKQVIIMCCIDVYTRFGMLWLLKDKTPEEVLVGIRKFVKKIGTPQHIFFDGGSEFKGIVESYLRDITDATKVTTYGDATSNRKIKTKMSIVERFNGTIRNSINIYVELNDLNRITQEDLNELADDYNSKRHRSIGVRPKDAMNGKATPKRVMYKYNIETNQLPFKVGDAVRVLIQYENMETGRKDKPRYTRDVYYIVNKSGNRYKLSDGDWYPYTRLMKSKDDITVFYYKKPSLRDRVNSREFRGTEAADVKKRDRRIIEVRRSTRERKKVDKLDL